MSSRYGEHNSHSDYLRIINGTTNKNSSLVHGNNLSVVNISDDEAVLMTKEEVAELEKEMEKEQLEED